MSDKVLKSIVERIENLESEKREIAISINEIYLEAKDKGFDVKAVRAAIKYRRDPGIFKELEERRRGKVHRAGDEGEPSHERSPSSLSRAPFHVPPRAGTAG